MAEIQPTMTDFDAQEVPIKCFRHIPTLNETCVYELVIPSWHKSMDKKIYVSMDLFVGLPKMFQPFGQIVSYCQWLKSQTTTWDGMYDTL